MQNHAENHRAGGKKTGRNRKPGSRQGIVILALALVTAALWGVGYRPGGLVTAVFSVSTPPAAPYRLNLNDASADELICLPGVGPSTAEAILALREALGGFRSPEELLSVSGIGPVLYEGILPFVTVPEEGE